jgi:TonB family protein
LTAQVTDGPGVTVGLGGAQLMHRPAVAYSQAALAQRVEGIVAVEATLDANGNVSDAHVVSGPQELRKTALQSVLQWHFGRAGAGATRVVTIRFEAPTPAMQPMPKGGIVAGMQPGPFSSSAGAAAAGGTSGLLSQMITGQMSAAQRATEPQRIASIVVSGLFEPFRTELIASLPVHEGDLLNPETLSTLAAAVRQYDEHLNVGTTRTASGGLELRITAPGGNVVLAVGAPAASPAAAPNALQVAGAVQEANLLKKVAPAYPELARQARIQGVVVLNAVIGKDGTVQSLSLVSGHPLLAPAALEAVKQWVYKPTLLNGQPVDVATQINVNFTLAD